MNLSVGLDCLDDPDAIHELSRIGADEFFAGFVPREWSEKFGWEVGLNRRTFGYQSQYLRHEELAEAIQAVHDEGKRFFITFNAHDYGSERLSLLHDTVRLVDDLQPDAYIVADPALMLMMFDHWGIERPMHLSTGAACFNSETIRFYCERFPVARVVIPRKMTLREMGRLMGDVGDLKLEFEVMVIGYRCHFNDEFCFSVHCGNGNNLCSDFVHADGIISRRFPDDWKDRLEAILANQKEQFREGSPLDRFRQAMRSDVPEPPTPSAPVEKGMDARIAQAFYNNCALCAIPRLRAMGVDVVKIPVRGSPWQKRRYLELVRMVVDDPNGNAARCRELVNSAGFCAAPQSCYYYVPEEAD